jgi:teichuronic acid exporter
LMSPRAFVALKRLDYKHWAMLQYGSSIAGTLITIMLAFAIRNVWALAIGFAAEYAVLCLLSYALFPFRPDIAFQRRSSQELLQFSKGVFGLSFLNLIYVRADVLVLGKLIPPDQLGIYAIAIYLAQAPAVFLLNYQGEILMPVFSHLQREPRATNAVLQHGVSLLLLAGLPLIVFVALSGRTVLSKLYGAQYGPGYWPFLIALVVALINIGNAQLTTTFYAAGKPQLHRVCLFAMALLMVVGIYPAAKFLGTRGAQFTALFAMIIGYGIQLRQARLLTGFRVNVEKSRVIQVLGPALVLGVGCYLRSWIGQLTPGFDLLFGAAAALTALLAASAGLLRPHRNVTTVSTTATEFRESN